LHVGLFAVIHSLPCPQRRFRFVVHCVISWGQQALRRLLERVKHLLVRLLVRLMEQLPVRLPLIWLLSTDEID